MQRKLRFRHSQYFLEQLSIDNSWILLFFAETPLVVELVRRSFALAIAAAAAFTAEGTLLAVREAFAVHLAAARLFALAGYSFIIVALFIFNFAGFLKFVNYSVIATDLY